MKILTWTEDYFSQRGVDSPRFTADVLLAHTLKVRRLDLYLQYDRPLDQGELAKFKVLIRKRASGEPVAYITGIKGFWEHEFKVSPHVLIPRPDTETLVEKALAFLSNVQGTPQVLELGVGSGAVIISLAKAFPDMTCFATDLSQDALDIAKENAIDMACDNLLFLAGSWFSPFKEEPMFHLIISNPPYIPSADIADLQPEVQHFEPHLALDGGFEGLDFLSIIISEGERFLLPGGALMLEMGFDQKNGVKALAMQSGDYQSIEFIKDLAGHDRVAVLKK